MIYLFDMTPKEKAEELFNKMCLAIATEYTTEGYYTNVIQAKKCALILVDEIRDNLPLITDIQQYWRDVKNEIEKL